MEQCNITNSEYKMRYIKFLSEDSNASSSRSIMDEDDSAEVEKDTTDEKTELSTADQIFLETTV